MVSEKASPKMHALIAKVTDKFNRVKHWRGFGVLAVAVIAFWCYSLIATYLQRPTGTENVLADLSPMTPFLRTVLLGLIVLPFAVYVAVEVFRHPR